MNNIDKIEVTKETQSTAPIAFTSAVEDSKENKRINKERTEQQRKTVKDFLKTINTKDIERTNLDESLFNEDNENEEYIGNAKIVSVKDLPRIGDKFKGGIVTDIRRDWKRGYEDGYRIYEVRVVEEDSVDNEADFAGLDTEVWSFAVKPSLKESKLTEDSDEVDISGKNIKVDNKVDLKALLDEYMSKNYGYDKVGDHYEYEMYADYSDELSDRTILKALESKEPLFEIEAKIDEAYDYGADYSDDLYKDFTKFLDKKDVDYDVDEVFDYLNDYVYFIPPYDHYLKQEVKCHLIVDTADANTDFTLNPNDMTTEEEIDNLDPEASIVWLAKTQGYNIEQLKEALKGNYGDSKFLKSVYEETINNVGNLSALTFLLKATVEDLLKVKEESLDVKVSPSVECGFFDVWNGGGSTLEIELEKPVTIPNEYIWAFEPDAKGGRVAYSVDDVYGLIGSAYKDAYEIVGEKQTK